MARNGRANTELDFWRYVDKRPDGHWIWLGPIDRVKQQGIFSCGDHSYRAHRFVFKAVYGLSVGQKQLVTPCPEPLCINPDHMDITNRKRLLRDDGRKECCRCREVKDLDDFYKMKSSRSGGTQNTCKACSRAITMDRNFERVYKTTRSEYEAIKKRQGGACALCRRPPKKSHLCIDHDHATGRIRGLLCKPCNTALAMLGDTKESLENALRYVS